MPGWDGVRESLEETTLALAKAVADPVTLASFLRIPVCMHNLEEAALFRPSAWFAFGTEDTTGADYRACAAFGPLYG
jgi:L-fucose/D-arabinose isomerase